MSDTSTPDISHDVLFGIAQLALEQVEGIRLLTPPPRVGEFLSGRRAKGITIDRDGESVDISLSVNVQYGLEIPRVSDRARTVVREAVASMTGLEVRSVRVNVMGIDTEQSPKESEGNG